MRVRRRYHRGRTVYIYAGYGAVDVSRISLAEIKEVWNREGRSGYDI